MLIILPCLAAKMAKANASILALAAAAGVSTTVVNRGRSAKPVLLHNGVAMMQALNECTFVYGVKGRRKGQKDAAPRKGNYHGSTTHPKVILPCLDAKIRAAGATNISLADLSGVSTSTINFGRRVVPIRLNLGIALYDTLRQHTFSRCPQGAK